MAVDERKRRDMYLSLEQALGREAADTLMELVPPVGWADVATKQDLLTLKGGLKALEASLAALEERLELKFDAKLSDGLNTQTKTLVLTMIWTMVGGMISVAVLAFGAAKLA